MSRQPKKTSFASKAIEDERITKRVVQFVDDPKNSDALAKIHEMSNKAKKAGKSPTHMSHIHIKDDDADKNDGGFNRRRAHFATVKHQNLNIFKDKQPIKETSEFTTSTTTKTTNITTNKGNKNNNNNPNEGGNSKKEYVWDKSINRLVEKTVGADSNANTKAEEPKEEKSSRLKRNYKKDAPQEKEEVVERVKRYRKEKDGKNDEGFKKKISVKVPRGNEKYSEIVYEKKVLGNDDNFDDEDLKQEMTSGGKSTKVYRKVVQNEPGSKMVITKKVIEENSERKDSGNLQFDSDDEDIEKHLKEFNINPSELSKKNVKIKIITEEYDENGNKIASKEITTNKLPKGLKSSNEIMDEFEKFEDEFDE